MASDSRIIISPRERFVIRAETLQDDAHFLKHLAEIKQRWNARDRAFAIEHETMPPEELLLASDNYLYPPRLASAQYRREDDGGDDDRAMRKLNMRVHQAKVEWRGFVRSLCEVHWRYLNPTNWMAPNAHPAQHFVAACLIYKPKFVDTGWIIDEVPMLVALPAPSHNASKTAQHRATIYEQARMEAFLRLCRRHLANQSMVLEEFEQFLKEATKAAEEATVEEANESTYPLPTPIMALALTPGMSKKDACDLARAGVEEAMTEAYYKNVALKLYAENVSISEISRCLGFDRHWVQMVIRKKSA